MTLRRIAIIRGRTPWNVLYHVGYFREEFLGILRFFRERPDWDIVGAGVPLPLGQTIVHGEYDDVTPESLADIDGVIVEGSQPNVTIPCLELGIPLVAINRYHDDPPLPTVYQDDTAIGRLGATYFLRRGFRSLAFCGPDYLTVRDGGYEEGPHQRWVWDRLAAFRETAREAGAECAVFFEPTGAPADEPDGSCVARFHEDLRKWVRELPRPVGIMACADVWAADCLQACKEERLRVPRDAAVLGVDNDLVRCEACRPGLSSIDRNMTRVGFEAAALLDRYLETGDWGTLPVVVPPAGVEERLSTETLAVENPKLATALRFVRSHFRDQISESDVARVVGISGRLLRDKFQRELGFSLVNEIRRLRVAKACELLTRTDLPLQTIAEAVGLRRLNYLCDVFTRELGVSPSAWRSSPRPMGRKAPKASPSVGPKGQMASPAMAAATEM